jgi:hypothetical protein
MIARLETIPLAMHEVAPVNRARLARYLDLPSTAQIDPVTEDEIRSLDARRDELLAPWQCAAPMPIHRVDGRWIELPGRAIESTDVYGRQLIDSGANALIVAVLTIGEQLDAIIRRHLDREEVYEAFVLKQWAATMTEQARVELTRGLRAWAEERCLALLPFDGPGYNGWPLSALNPLLELLYGDCAPTERPIRATESGVLLPTNSMLIVFGVTPRPTAARARGDELLAQCHRCAMRNCRYRVAATAQVAGGTIWRGV